MVLSNGRYMGIKELPLEKGKKTSKYEISEHNSDGSPLGVIAWYGAWRAFCFYPNPSVVFDSGCIKQIVEWLDALNNDHKESLKKAKEIKKTMDAYEYIYNLEEKCIDRALECLNKLAAENNQANT